MPVVSHVMGPHATEDAHVSVHVTHMAALSVRLPCSDMQCAAKRTAYRPVRAA